MRLEFGLVYYDVAVRHISYDATVSPPLQRNGILIHGLLYHSHIHEYAKCTWDVHIYIYIYRTLESQNTKNTYDFSLQVRNFLLPLSLKVHRHKEREAQSFYSGFFICPPPSRATPAQGLREQAKVNSSRSVSSLNSSN